MTGGLARESLAVETGVTGGLACESLAVETGVIGGLAAGGRRARGPLASETYGCGRGATHSADRCSKVWSLR